MKLMFCFPGESFSKNWMISWSKTVRWLYKNNITYSTIHAYSPVIYNCRNMLLGGIGYPAKDFKPFNGAIEYDWIIWIDNDNLWEPKDLEQLLSNNDHKVVTGFYIQHDNKTYAQSIYQENSNKDLLWLTRDTTLERDRFKLAASGMGFMAVKAGVFESLEYPFFTPITFGTTESIAFLSEDTSFCYRIKKLGYDIWGDPNIQIKHEKIWLLSGNNIDGEKPQNLVLNS